MSWGHAVRLRPSLSLAARSMFALALLLLSSLAWSRTMEALPRYDMHVRVNPEASSVSVDLDVTLPPSTAPRTSLQFKLLPTMGTPEVRLVAPSAAGTLAVRKIGEEGDAFKPRAIWEIKPAAPFAAHQPISLHFAYSGGGTPSQSQYIGPDVVFVSGIGQPWYPQFSEGKSLGSLRLDMPSRLLALASGERVSERIQGDRRSIDFRMTWPTKFSFIAGPYKVRKAAQKAGEIPVSFYLLRDRDYAGDLANLARRALAILEKEFGPYPYKEFAIAEMPTDAGMKATFTGASLDGFIVWRSDSLDLRKADPFMFGHEIGHQWWGVSISPDGAGKRDRNGEVPIIYMLNEALAQYGALRVIESLMGPDESQAFRDEQRDKTIKFIAAGVDEPLADLPNSPPTFYWFSHAKGSLAYDLIRQGIGPDRMRQFFHEVTSAYAYSSLSWDEFVARLRKAAGPDKRWLIDQWLYQKGLPVLDLKWSSAKHGVALEIDQHQPGMPLYRLEQLPVRIVYTDGSADIRDINIAAQSQTRAVLTASKPVSRVELDPKHKKLWASPQEFAAALAIKDATQAWALWDSGRNAEAEKILTAALDARTAPDATPAEFLERYNYGWLIEEVYHKLPEALDQYMRAVELPVRSEKELPQLYINIARVASALGDKARARWAAEAAIALDEAKGKNKQGLKTRLQHYLN